MRSLVFAFLLLGAGCIKVPAVDAVVDPEADSAPYPALVPIEDALAADAPRMDPELEARVTGRATALQARAEALSDRETISPEARARIDAGITRP